MSEEADFGPAMRALTDRQRRFVMAMLSDPMGNATRWAKAAGYSDVKDGAKVRAHECMRNENVLLAIQEEAVRHLHAFGPALAVGVMMKIAKNPKHKQQLRAAEALANRTGLHEVTEQRHFVERTDRTGRAMVERIKQLADILGVDPARLLGANAAPEMKLVEGKVVENGSD